MKQPIPSCFPDNWKEKSKDLNSWLKELDQNLASNPDSLESKLAWVYCNLENNTLPAVALSSPLGELFPRLLESSNMKLSGSKVYEILALKLFEKKQYKLAITFYEKAIELNESHESLTGEKLGPENNSLYSSFKEALEKELLSAEKRKEPRSYKEALEEKIKIISSVEISDVRAVNVESSTPKELKSSETIGSDTSKKDDISFLANQSKEETRGLEDDSSDFKFKPIREGQVAESPVEGAPSSSFLPLVFCILAGLGLAFLFNNFRGGDFSLDFLFEDSASDFDINEAEFSELELEETKVPEENQIEPASRPLPKSQLEKVVSETSPKNSKVYSRLTDKIENIGKNAGSSESALSENTKNKDIADLSNASTSTSSPQVLAPEPILEPQIEGGGDSQSSSSLEEEIKPNPETKKEVKTLPKLPSNPKREVIDKNDSREEFERKGRRRRRPSPLSKPSGVPVNKFDTPRTYEVVVQTDVYTAPSLRSSALVRLERGAKIKVIARFGRWLELKSKEGNRGFIFAQDAAER